MQAIGELPKTQRLNIVIGLPLRNQQALADFLHQLYDPTSPQYHEYLTPDQFTEKFGPTAADYQTLMNFAQAAGLKVTRTHRNRTLIDVRGSVADVEKLFHVTLRTYNHPTEARTFYAPDTAPSLDVGLPVLSVGGLDNYVLPRPMVNMLPAATYAPHAQLMTGSGPYGTYLGNDFRAAYVPGVSLTGAGQTVGLLEFDGYYTNDIAAYEKLGNLPVVPVTNVLVNGYNGAAGDASDEVSLDIEMAISMGPGLAEIVVYEAGPNGTGNEILNEMAAPSLGEPLSLQLSSSWSFAIDASTEQIFQQFAAQGQSFFNASGDDCAWTSGADIPTPLGDTNITIVGGTTLTTSGPGGSWQSETAWNWAYLGDYGIGTGGGITSFNIPPWQQGIDMTTNEGSTILRNIPDVALTADNIVVIYGNGQSNDFGGTSCATPLWATFTALVNQQAAEFGRPPVGFINPAIYALAQGPLYGLCFHDITTGSNTDQFSPSYYYASPGYDLCTGWGTPNGSNLINTLAPPDSLIISPGIGISSQGNVGGPFTITSVSLTLTNAGTSALNWSLSKTSPWLEASATTGSLSPQGASSTVVLSLNVAASNLVAGTYTAMVWFTNLNDSIGQGFYFKLSVLGAPIVTMQPQSHEVVAQSNVSFTVSASGAAPLSYFWVQNGAYITGATNPIYTIYDVPLSDSGSLFRCVISNAFGSVTSLVASLTVDPLPFYSFGGPNGANPYGGLVQGNDGSLYGTTTSGSTPDSPYGLGTVFKITTNGVLTTLAVFNGTNGAIPEASLVQGTDGNFYGTTVNGGYGVDYSEGGYGTVFRISPAGVLTSLVWFNNTDGSWPSTSLVQGKDGDFYSTTWYGGAYFDDGSDGFGAGTAFRMSPDGTLTSLVSFDGTNGVYPSGSLVQGSDGNFYGTTFEGENGSLEGPEYWGNGTVFRMTTNGNVTTLVTFNGADGASPRGLTLAADGNFYGTTDYGGDEDCGTVFRMTPDGVLTTLVSFNYFGSGAFPTASVLQASDGYFYGTTPYTGMVPGGTVFRMAYDGTFTTLLTFTGPNGSEPVGALMQGADGNLYGTTALGGTGGKGTVFRIPPPPSPPAIGVQPLSETVAAGGSARISVIAAGSAPLQYSWLLNGQAIAGATNPSLSLSNVTVQDAGSYVVVVSNSFGSVTSAPAALTVSVPVEPPPGIIAWWPGQSNALDVVGGHDGVLMNGAGFAPAEVG
ncbi:MAG: choice-of-anchor tandem repeat GloVer-containing protein, partial [Verrucomicrobiota bacterium]